MEGADEQEVAGAAQESHGGQEQQVQTDGQRPVPQPGQGQAAADAAFFDELLGGEPANDVGSTVAPAAAE